MTYQSLRLDLRYLSCATGGVVVSLIYLWWVSLCGLPGFHSEDVIPLDRLAQWPYTQMAYSTHMRGKPGRSVFAVCPNFPTKMSYRWTHCRSGLMRKWRSQRTCVASLVGSALHLRVHCTAHCRWEWSSTGGYALLDIVDRYVMVIVVLLPQSANTVCENMVCAP